MNTESFDKVVQCDSIGFQITKEYFNWNDLSIVEQHYKSSQVVYLANLIDSKFKAEYSEVIELLEDVYDNCDAYDDYASRTLCEVSSFLDKVNEDKYKYR